MSSKLTRRIATAGAAGLAVLALGLGVAAPAAQAHDTQMEGTEEPAQIVERGRVPAEHRAALDEWRAAMPPATGDGDEMSCRAALIAAGIHQTTANAFRGVLPDATAYFTGLATGLLQAAC